jgi:hypothetical protein
MNRVADQPGFRSYPISGRYVNLKLIFRTEGLRVDLGLLMFASVAVIWNEVTILQSNPNRLTSYEVVRVTPIP